MKATHGSIGLLLLGVVACHPTTFVAHVQPKGLPTEEDCNAVYSRVLAIAVCENIPSARNAPTDEFVELGRHFDDYYRSKGVTVAFYNKCMFRMNMNQVNCMKNAETFDAMSMCSKMFEEPPPIDEMPAKDTSL